MASASPLSVQVGLRVASYATLPALALQALSTEGVAGPEAAAVAASAGLYFAAIALLSW